MIKTTNLKPIYILGPTASGKSELAFRLAQKLNGIIISADSMQIYRGLDIGTAKEDNTRRAIIDHKLIDVVDCNENFSVAEFKDRATTEISNAILNKKLPIIVGGTGLYFESLFYPMTFAKADKDEELRQKLNDELSKNGASYMHKKLESLDKETANRLHENDTKRVIRALEIILTTGKTLKENSDDKKEPENIICVGLNTDRSVLYDKINKRVDIMFEQGLINEVYAVGGFSYQSMQAIGYKEFAEFKPNYDGQNFLLDENDINIIKEKIKKDTRNYAKRQLTWFRRYKFIKWFECGEFDEAIKYIENRLNGDTNV